MATCRRCLCARPGQHVTLWWIGSTASSGASNVLGYSTLQLQRSTTPSPSHSCPQLLCTQQRVSAVCPSLRFVRAKTFNEVFSACSALAHRHTHTHTHSSTYSDPRKVQLSWDTVEAWHQPRRARTLHLSDLPAELTLSWRMPCSTNEFSKCCGSEILIQGVLGMPTQCLGHAAGSAKCVRQQWNPTVTATWLSLTCTRPHAMWRARSELGRTCAQLGCNLSTLQSLLSCPRWQKLATFQLRRLGRKSPWFPLLIQGPKESRVKLRSINQLVLISMVLWRCLLVLCVFAQGSNIWCKADMMECPCMMRRHSFKKLEILV